MKKNIIIEGHKSDWYEKAVFILKDSKNTQIPSDLVTYADDILEKRLKTGKYTYHPSQIDKYTAFNASPPQTKKTFHWNWIDDFFGISLGILGISIIFYFLF